MLRPKLQAAISDPGTLLFSPSSASWPSKPTWLHPRGPMAVGAGCPAAGPKRRRLRVVQRGSGTGQVARASDFTSKAKVATKVVVTVKRTVRGILSNLGIERWQDRLQDVLGRSLFLDLVSAEVDEKTGLEKGTISGYARLAEDRNGIVTYEADLEIGPDFGPVGAIMVQNEHRKEMFVKDITLTGLYEPVVFSCNSWVHSKYDNPDKRVFFTVKSYLPSETPSGIVGLRESELLTLRGDGEGERKIFERIYDYDVYNDLGDPSSPDTARPVLGGSEEHPYPRRCRTGRPRTKEDPLTETRADEFYVPRDESFSEVKEVTFNVTTLRSVLRAVVPAIRAALSDPDLGFPYFTAIQKLYDEGVNLANVSNSEPAGLTTILPRIIKTVSNAAGDLLLFEMPEVAQRDRFSWLRDEEFSRQAIAGLNPLGIQLVTEFPLASKLDPNVYGPPESAITEEIIEREIDSRMTAQEVIRQKRLFVLDYHDFLLPYVHKVRELEGTTLYGSRTLFFLCDNSTLQPIAIELTRPMSSSAPQWKQVFTHCWDATDAWLWRVAKIQVLAHDSGIHELVSHWLRTHCCVEPYVIAAQRQLSEMHPIYRLLHPHFRYTMDINALARQSLINAGGIIETSFSPKNYSLEMSSAWYDQLWRFDMEALPADLIRRGMAEADPTAEHGLRLTIEDYPYANDGLLIWSAIKQWVSDYVSHYYPDDSSTTITSDRELQSWWTEVRTKGHADKKDEPWWPVIDSKDSLIHVLTTVIWVASGHHAAVNFGQYHYAGYFPSRPTIARKNIPTEDPDREDFQRFMTRPEDFLMEIFPSQVQATVVMAVLNVLSTHSVEEEYIGATFEETWKADPVIRAAYERFSGRLKEIEGIIDERNVDGHLMNRFGAGLVPYELLKPFSEPGVTGKGIPNSISI